MHCHPLISPATGTYSVLKSEMGFYVCAVQCVHRYGTSNFKPHPRRLHNVQLIPYPRGLQQNQHLEWESNLFPSASTGSQVQLTIHRPLRLTNTFWVAIKKERYLITKQGKECVTFFRYCYYLCKLPFFWYFAAFNRFYEKKNSDRVLLVPYVILLLIP